MSAAAVTVNKQTTALPAKSGNVKVIRLSVVDRTANDHVAPVRPVGTAMITWTADVNVASPTPPWFHEHRKTCRRADAGTRLQRQGVGRSQADFALASASSATRPVNSGRVCQTGLLEVSAPIDSDIMYIAL
jgi:hypothetical protein